MMSLLTAAATVMLSASRCSSPVEEYDERRRRMVEEQLQARDIDDPQVLAAMGRVPRHLFVPEALRFRAYANHPLPIGNSQAISQPYIVALMTELAELEPDDVVLEIGTDWDMKPPSSPSWCARSIPSESLPNLAERRRRGSTSSATRM